MTLSEFSGAVLRSLVRLFGHELVPTRDVPFRTFAGLRKTEFGTILDIGANSGAFAYYARRRLRFREMHCFEPLEGPFRELDVKARKLSRAHSRIFVHPVALGSQTGEANIYSHRDHSVSSSLLVTTRRNLELFPQATSQERNTIRLERLDDYIEQKKIQLLEPCLVKMDVQGFEEEVIRGGQSVLGRSQAVLLEVNLEPMYEGQATFQQLFRSLDRLGFVYQGNLAQLHTSSGRIISCDALFFRPEFIAAVGGL